MTKLDTLSTPCVLGKIRRCATFFNRLSMAILAEPIFIIYRRATHVDYAF
jgi:hypothetical protein